MHIYTLTITKEDFSLEFKSNDKKITEKELKIWINWAAEFSEDNPEKIITKSEKKEVIQEKIELGNILLEMPTAPYVRKKEYSLPAEEKPRHSYKISDETKEILQRAIHKPLPKMNDILKSEAPQIQEKIEMPQSPSSDILSTTPVTETESVITLEPQDFTTIYNQKIMRENNSSDRFAQLLSLSNIHNKFDCLIACAYHLVERENFERFTLKQINTLSKALLEEAIEHDTLKEALEKRFIKIVPDYTGIATTMEYTLTDQGVKYFKDVIAED